MKELRIGDRVSAYSVWLGHNEKNENTKRWTGVVIEFSKDLVRIKRDNQGPNDGLLFHRIQCRKLVSKKRREWTLYLDKFGGIFSSVSWCGPDPCPYEQVKVREIKK